MLPSYRLYKMQSHDAFKQFIIVRGKANTNISISLIKYEYTYSLQEILRECQTFARDPILAKVDCMVLALLSHGTADNVISGTDGIGIHVVEEICPIFSAKRCLSLCGKPKMYIFNACRGGEFIQLQYLRPFLQVLKTTQTTCFIKLQDKSPFKKNPDLV